MRTTQRRGPLGRRDRHAAQWFVGAVLIGMGFLSASAASAQLDESCELLSSRNYSSIMAGQGHRIHYMTVPVFRCDNGATIRSDSAAIFDATQFGQFIGNVVFDRKGRRLESDRANFFSSQDQLRGYGNVILTDEARGSRITGDSLVLLMANDSRPDDQLTVTGGRPHATLFLGGVADSTEVETQPAPGREKPTAEPLAGPPDPPAGTLDTPATQVPTRRRGRPNERSRPGAPGAVVPPATAVETVVEAVVDSAVVSLDPDGAPTEPEQSGVAPDTVKVPYEIDADRIFLEGDRYFRATGTVEILRDSLEAYADSVEYDETAGRIFLTKDARIVDASFVLTGLGIMLVAPGGGDIEEVIAHEEAHLDADRMDVEGGEIRVYMDRGDMERLVAVKLPEEEDEETQERPNSDPDAEEVPTPQPRTLAENFVLTGDSIEVIAPAAELQSVTAVGHSRGVTSARDSLNTEDTPEIAREDWLEGDTIVATFVPLEDSAQAVRPASDTASAQDYVLERLVASGSARSLYRLEPSDTMNTRPGQLAIHFVTGDAITIIMTGGEVDRMEVEGQTRGLHLEPEIVGVVTEEEEGRQGGGTPPPVAVRSDSTAAASRVVPPDTTMVLPPGVRP